MANSGMSLDQIKRDVLESCSEDTHGSWELWWGSEKKDPATETELKKLFVEAVDQLVREKKIKAVHHGPWASPDAKYTEATYDRARLEYEIDHSLKETGLDPDTFFWFDLTEDGKAALDVMWQYDKLHLQGIKDMNRGFREQKDDLWVGIGRRLTEKGIDISKVVIAASFPEDFAMTYVAMVTGDKRIYEFYYQYMNTETREAEPLNGVITEWQDFTDNIRGVYLDDEVEIVMRNFKEIQG
jgi:hypothetical protein